MKHLCISLVCLFITPVFAQKGLRSKLNAEIDIQHRIQQVFETISEAELSLKTEKKSKYRSVEM